MKTRILALFCLLAILTTLTFTSCGKDTGDVKLIDLNGCTQSDVMDWSVANHVADKINYQFEYSDEIPSDYFIRASLEVGSTIKDSFDVVISLGKNEEGDELSLNGVAMMPNVIGMTLTDAQNAIKEQFPDANYSVYYEDSEGEKGTVIRSHPGPGSSKIYADNTIILWVSNGLVEKKDVDITFPIFVTSEMMVRVYVNDVFQQSITEFGDDPDITEYTVTVSGSGITTPVRIEISNRTNYFIEPTIWEYTVNFEKGTYGPSEKKY